MGIERGEIVFLTAEQVAELTGKARHSAQVRELRRMRYIFTIRADGMPLVARDHVLARHGVGRQSTLTPTDEPDFAEVR